MSRDRHHGVLATTFCFAVYMFLVIHHVEGGSECQDGFCGRWCSQRCPYPSSTCDNSCLRPRTLKMTSALGQIQGRYKEGSNANPCAKKFGNNCIKCNQCNKCLEGYYGSKCNQTCIGHCQFDCDIETGLCRTCKDGFRADNCSVPCSKTCNGKACKRSTGACNDGCSEGYCSARNGCDKNCSDNCSHCDFETCVCSTSSSPETPSTTPSSPKQGSILAAYLISCILNTVYLVFFIAYGYEQKLWTSLNCLCNKTPESETNGAEGIAMVEVTGQKSPQTNTDSGSTTTSCCSPVQSTRRVFLGILVYVVLNVVVCAMIYVYM